MTGRSTKSIDGERAAVATQLRRVDAIGLAVVAALLAGGWAFELAPTRARVAELSAASRKAETAAAETDRLRSLRDRLAEELRLIEEDRDRLETVLPRRRDESETVQQLIALAAASGLSLERVEPRPSQGDLRCEVVSLGVVGRGEFAAVLTFLHRMTALPRAQRSGLVTLTRGESGVEVRLEHHVYRRPVVMTARSERGTDRE